MGTKKYFPGILGAILLSLLLVVMSLFLSIAVEIVLMLTGGNNFISIFSKIVITLITCFLIVFIGVRKNKEPVRSYLKLNSVPFLFYIVVSLMAFGIIFVNSEISNIIIYFIPMPDFIQNLFKDMIVDKNIFAALLLVAVLPAITEELIFRGVILNGLSRNYSQKVAIVVSALLFGIVHLNPWQFLPAFTIGIFLAWICLKTGSIFLCMFIHFLNNAITIFITRVDVPIEGLKLDDTGAAGFQPVWIDILGIILVFAGILMIKKLLEKYKKVLHL